MAEENKPRVYGMADQANRDPPPAQGMRGEQSAPGPRANDPQFSHMVTLETGKRVAVAEGNGVAYAEATGRIQRPEETEELEVAFTPEEDAAAETRPRRSGLLLLGVFAVGAAAGLYLVQRARQSPHRPQPQPAREQDTRALVPVSAEHETGPLVPVERLPHQQPYVAEINPSA